MVAAQATNAAPSQLVRMAGSGDLRRPLLIESETLDVARQSADFRNAAYAV
jgi:hypothetical protein